VKALAVSGQMLGAEQLDVLAKLPTRDQALAMLMSVMNAPVTKLVRTMNEVPGKLVRTVAAVRDQKEAAA
jgi:large subunit ribosomal protein L10